MLKFTAKRHFNHSKIKKVDLNLKVILKINILTNKKEPGKVS